MYSPENIESLSLQTAFQKSTRDISIKGVRMTARPFGLKSLVELCW